MVSVIKESPGLPRTNLRVVTLGWQVAAERRAARKDQGDGTLKGEEDDGQGIQAISGCPSWCRWWLQTDSCTRKVGTPASGEVLLIWQIMFLNRCMNERRSKCLGPRWHWTLKSRGSKIVESDQDPFMCKWIRSMCVVGIGEGWMYESGFEHPKWARKRCWIFEEFESD